MTSQNARMNQSQQVNDQLRTIALKFALDTRAEGEEHEHIMQRARDYYEFLKVGSATSLQLVGANEVPGVM